MVIFNRSDWTLLLTLILMGIGETVHQSIIGASASAKRGKLATLSTGQIPRFAFALYLFVYFDTKLNKGVTTI